MEEKKSDRIIGEVIEADTEKGIFVKIAQEVELVKQGMPICVQSERFTYFCVIEQIASRLDKGMQGIAGSGIESEALEKMQPYYYGSLMNVIKLNCLRKVDNKTNSVFPFDSIPPSFARCIPMQKSIYEKVYEIDQASIIGCLRDFADYPISINLDNLTETSFALFGTTGSGKSILFKLLVLKLIETRTCQVLILDPQHEYGMSSPDGMPGLKLLFPNQVVLFAMDASGDKTLRINPDNLQIADFTAIIDDLSEPAMYALQNYNRVKAQRSLREVIFDTSVNVNAHEATLNALRARIRAITSFDFFDETIDRKKDSLQDLKRAIIDERKSVVIDLGKYGTKPFAYKIIAGIVARLFYDEYSNKKDKEYPRFVFALEEAHKFMNIDLFANIAREMRKFNMILALIDQIPSSINSEILSQLNNRFVMKLNMDRDIDNALQGVDGGESWKGTIKRFPMPRSLHPPRSCCFIYGSCISMPSVIEVLDFMKYVQKPNINPGNTGVMNQFDVTNMDGVL